MLINNLTLLTLLTLLTTPSPTCLTSKTCRECVRNNCLKCAFSYRNAQNLCTLPHSKIPNCVSYLHEHYCIECQKGFYLDSGYCTKCTQKNCAVCPEDTCIACFKGIKMENGCEETKCGIDNCEICFFNDFCSVCEEGFALVKVVEAVERFVCRRTEHGCESLMEDGRCATCGVDRVLDGDSYCVEGDWVFPVLGFFGLLVLF